MKLALLLIILSITPVVSLSGQPNGEKEVRAVMSDFLASFNNLDWESFRRFWSDQPVMFHPAANAGNAGDRIDDAKRFEESWRAVFDAIRSNAIKRRVTQPPYQNIQPRDLRVDFPSANVAVVTFHLGGGAAIGRRLFVLAKEGDTWKITHLHASNLTLKPPAQ